MRNFKKKLFDKQIKQELSIKNGIMIVDESSCDACGHCIDTCPQSAINMKTLSADDVKNLSFKGRLKVRIKGNQKAAINPDVCTSCGLCMMQCHELAIHKVERLGQTVSSNDNEKLAI